MNQKEQVLGPLARALAVLRFVAANRRPATAAEIAAALKLPLPTAHRLIANLEALGYLSRPVGEKGIVPGPELVGLSADAFVFAFAGSGVNAVLRKACDAIGEQCEITVGRRGYMEYLATAKVDMAAGLQFDAGRRSPLHCTSSGKLYLSTLDDAALAKLVPTLPLERFTAHTVTEPEELIRQVHEARRNGFAKSNEEYVAGVVGCSVPINRPKGGLIACFGMSAPTARFPFNRLESLIPYMRDVAGELAAQLVG